MQRSFDQEQDNLIAAEYAAGVSSVQLATNHGCSVTAVKNAIRRAGGLMRTRNDALRLSGVRLRKISDEEESRMVTLYVAGESLEDVGAKHDVSYHVVARALKRCGIKCRRHTRTHTLNETVFDHCETDLVAAYWCGMMFADGCVWNISASQGAGLSLALSGEDGDHVYDFRNFLQSSHKIDHRIPKNDWNAAERAALCIRSRRLVDALSRYGVVPRKSLMAEVKLLEMSSDFWRGAVCGDGWLRIDEKRNRPHVGICGSLQTIQQFRRFCLALTDTKAVPWRVGKVWYFGLTCSKAVAVVRDLFDNTGPALPRKKKLAMDILRRFG